MKAAEVYTSQHYAFGSFRLTTDERRLYRNGEVVLLPPKEFDLLLLLVRNPGQVMERERLIKALWPNTVVEEANLNVHISALRKALAEGSGEQQYIETLPRLGYRFVAAVKVFEPELATSLVTGPTNPAEDSAPMPDQVVTLNTGERVLAQPQEDARRRAVGLPFWLLAVVVLCALAYLVFKPNQPKSISNVAEPALNVVPLTTYAGRESQPAFSPDGNQIAFTWSGEKDSDTDIYVRLVEGGNWVRLTEGQGDKVNPTWSPDGRRVAYYRRAAEGDGIFLVPALGGAERKLTDVWSNRFGFGSHSWLHWSPDGKWLVLSDKSSAAEPFSLYLISPETGERHRLTSPPASVIGDCSPAFSPDSRQLAFVRVISAVVGEVYLVAVEGGEPKQLTFDGAGAGSVAWMPSGRELVFTSRHAGRSHLFRLAIDSGQPQWLAAGGNEAIYPTFARQGNRLAWTQNTNQSDIWRVTLKGQAGAAKPSGLIASTASETSPSYSPDGRRIVFVSSRSGSDEIWVSGSAGENPIPLTSFRGPLAGSPRWSPDGKQIVFDCRPEGNADIFIVSSEGGRPRRLTSDPAEDIVPSWSSDGRWVYFTSSRNGGLQVWKVAAEGGEAVPVTKQGGFEPVESPDGQWLYFTKDRGSSAIWRMPVGGGEETAVFDFNQKNYSRLWTVGMDGLYFAAAAAPARSAINFFSFATGSVRAVAEFEGNLPNSVSGLTFSPDKNWLLFPVVAQRGSDLMMIEDFR